MGLFGKKNDEETRDSESSRRDRDQERIELREEELTAQKERVEAGEVRLRKEVIEEEKTIEVPVSHEEVIVEKHSVHGRRPADGEIGDSEEIRVPLTEEEVRVEKTPVVREEINLRKRQVQDTERVSESVKREEAWVDTTGDAQARINSAGSAWQGKERRRRTDRSYSGPDRRVASL
jgi:uncharacterized protein (TIGR02271 family)